MLYSEITFLIVWPRLLFRVSEQMIVNKVYFYFSNKSMLEIAHTDIITLPISFFACFGL